MQNISNKKSIAQIDLSANHCFSENMAIGLPFISRHRISRNAMLESVSLHFIHFRNEIGYFSHCSLANIFMYYALYSVSRICSTFFYFGNVLQVFLNLDSSAA